MVLILILAADTRCTAQSASVQRPIQLSYAICARSDRGRRRELRGCAAAAIDEKRGQQHRKLFPASVAHRSHFNKVCALPSCTLKYMHACMRSFRIKAIPDSYKRKSCLACNACGNRTTTQTSAWTACL